MDDQQLSRNNYRVAVITGASRGIGRGIAYELGLDETMSWVDTVLAGLLEPAGKALEANTNVENLGYGQQTINEVDSEIDRPTPSPRTVQLLDDQRPVDPTLDLSVESIAEEISSSSSSRTKSIGIPVP
eukprot:CAMPEP_0113516082 /NCGR_PEP_ID=MMETSP0014_2-20120614/41342_1 /TAXON_ID=2857 /ORGANISM="Nitzschia sp." /LENGTH=128 /DNA_ID=CAMNT_0000412801 /DNA_START=182 /DNA_END=565 /DNA_ORIENTATION=+ /assembly_acc=CAM_ASM_000159